MFLKKVFWGAAATLLHLGTLAHAETDILILQPGAEGKDAIIQSRLPDLNRGDYPMVMMAAWTWGGEYGAIRSLIEFDLSAIPVDSEITKATIELYGDASDGGAYPGHSTLSGSNMGYINLVTSPWSESTVTWATMPTFSSTSQVLIPATSFNTQMFNIDVTRMVKEMRAGSNYGFMIRLADESPYRALKFSSSDAANSFNRPMLVLTLNSPTTEGLHTGRKWIEDFTPAERAQFSDLMRNYITEEIIEEHATSHDWHDPISASFILGHHDYLARAEAYLTQNGGEAFVPLPMWNPTNTIPEELRWVKANDDGTPRPALERFSVRYYPMPTNLRSPAICNFATAADLASTVSTWHNNVEIGVGGSLVSEADASAAVIFWSWHAYIDNIYARWRLCDTVAPTAPADLALSQSAGETSASVAWTAATDNRAVVGYDIYLGDTKVGSTGAETAFELTGLQVNTTYQVTVVAHDAVGNTSEPSNVLQFTTPDLTSPSAPASLVRCHSSTATQVAISWLPSTDNVGVVAYDLYHKGAKVGSSNRAGCQVINGLKPNTGYTVTVVARDAAGNVSGPSNALTIGTLRDTTPPTAPTGLAQCKAKTPGVAITWNAATDNVRVVAYDFYNNGTKLLGSLTRPGCQAIGVLPPNKTYQLTVVARDAAGNKSAPSNVLRITSARK